MADDHGVTSDDSGQTTPTTTTTTTTRTRKRAATKTPAPAATPSEPTGDAGSTAEAGAEAATAAPAKKAAAKKAPARKTAAKKAPAKKATTKKAATPPAAAEEAPQPDAGQEPPSAPGLLFQPPPAEPAPRKPASDDGSAEGQGEDSSGQPATKAAAKKTTAKKTPAKKTAAKKTAAKKAAAEPSEADSSSTSGPTDDAPSGRQQDGSGSEGEADSGDGSSDDGEGQGQGQRRRRRRGGRRRGRKGGGEQGSDDSDDSDSDDQGDDSSGDGGAEGSEAGDSDSDDQGEGGSSSSSRRRRRRRRSGETGDGSPDDPDNTVTKVRSARAAEDEITAFTGSTRLEAKKQRRREGREAGRRRAPVISEAEFLARRESVERAMVIRQRKDLTQIAVLEDKVLVEHYVARESQTSLIGNVYLGKVQNVLPSMEAAFIDIGRGRNAVLYAGEVNWDALGAGNVSGKDRKIEQVLKPGQAVLVQVTKDPIGHKGARLTSQISLPGRFLVYVPEGNTSGISRKLPDNERNRLKTLLKEIVPSEAGVIVRTAAEGAAEEELRHDVARLKARWEDIAAKVESGSGSAPQELYSEPDLTLKVVRDLFTEDFKELVVSGDDAWDMVQSYVEQVAPDLADRLSKHDDSEGDAFSAYRIDEQINKALERKVWLPSGGSLIIDRTEAMTVVDVNTGKFTGSGGNLEETVTKNNLEAAEEIVRQLRLRDIGGIIVIDFIDMVLESNRELVLRRLIECLGRDRTRHQVAEVTSLGLVQMTRKRIGTGLLEAFSETCDHCQGRGVHVHSEPVESKRGNRQDDEPRRGRRGKSGGSGGSDEGAKSDNAKSGKQGGKGKGKSKDTDDSASESASSVRRPTPAEFAAMAAHRAEDVDTGDTDGTSSLDTPPDKSADKSTERPGTEAVAAGTASEASPSGPAPSEPAAAPDEAPAPTSSPEPSPEPEPVAAAPVDSTPRIVTSTRRRGANRAAGPPRGDATAPEATDAGESATSASEASAAPSEAASEADTGTQDETTSGTAP